MQTDLYKLIYFFLYKLIYFLLNNNIKNALLEYLIYLLKY